MVTREYSCGGDSVFLAQEAHALKTWSSMQAAFRGGLAGRSQGHWINQLMESQFEWMIGRYGLVGESGSLGCVLQEVSFLVSSYYGLFASWIL